MCIKFPKSCCRTKIETRDGWMSLKYKTRKDLYGQYSDWQTQDDFFPERPTKYNGCPPEKMVKLRPSVKIVFSKAQMQADHDSVFTIPEAEALATKLKQCIADNSKIVVV